jgi:hypothetical protein
MTDIPTWISEACSIVDATLAECVNREVVSASEMMDKLLDLRILLSTIEQKEKEPQ